MATAAVTTTTEELEGSSSGGEDIKDKCDYYCPSDDDYRITLPVNYVPKFQRVMAPCVVEPLSPEMSQYLISPQLIIPTSLLKSSREHHICNGTGEGGDGNESDSEGSWGSSPSNPPSPPIVVRHFFQSGEGGWGSDGEDSSEVDSDRKDPAIPSSPQSTSSEVLALAKKIDEQIEELGGNVLVKVNWKAPKDARWIALNKSLKCATSGDVLLLLKHSMTVERSIEKLATIGEKPLVTHYTLAKWEDTFSPEFEFRCFVVRQKLVLISQRDMSQAYCTIADDRDGIIEDIHRFYRLNLFETVRLDYYTFDVMRTHNRVVLIDFNVWGDETEPCLTSYKDLEHLIEETEMNLERGGVGYGLCQPEKYGEPYFRYSTETVVGKMNPNMQCPLPFEVATHVLDINKTFNEIVAGRKKKNPKNRKANAVALGEPPSST